MAKEKVTGNRTNFIIKEIGSWVFAFALAVFAAVMINNYLIVNASVPSESMEPSIHIGDRVIGFRLAYANKEPQRGDIIVFKYPDNEAVLYVKRIIGMPGESLQIRGGRVYINGSTEPLEESYVVNADSYDSGVYHVPEDCYFVMGDNRPNSRDSRLWNNTYVSRNKIIGRAVFRLFPKPGKLV